MAKAVINTINNKGPATFISAKSVTSFKWNYCLIAFAVPFLLYIFSVRNGYNLDDELVTKNQRLTSQGIAAIPEIFRSNYYSDNMGYAYEYRPVVLSSFAVEHQFFGDNPFVSHFINVLLYAFLCFLLYRCLRRFFKNTNYLFSLLITLVFAFHPAHTEVVCSIKNRDELFAMIFGLLAFRFAMLFTDKKGFRNLVIMAVFFILGLLSKKSTLIFGAVIPLFVLVYSGEILATVATGVILYLSGSIVNPGMMVHDWRLVLLIIPVLFLLYSFPDVKSNDVQNRLVKALKSLNNLLPSGGEEKGNNAGATSEKKKEPAGAVMWAITIINIAAFALLFYYKTILLTAPALVAMGLFVAARNRNLQIANLLAFTLITALVINRFFDPFIYLLAVSIMGILYYYNINYLRKIILFFAVLILLGAFPKFGKMGPGVVVLAMFILYTRYNTRFIAGLYVIIAITLGWKMFLAHHAFGLANALHGFNKVRFFFFGLLIIFLSLPRNIKLLYRSSIIMVFALMLLAQIDEPVKSKLAGEPAVGNSSLIEPGTSLRPLTYSEAPVTTLSPLRIRLGTSAMISLKYVEKVLIPWPLSFYYGFKEIEPTDIISVWPLFGVALYLGLILFGFLMLKRSMAVFAGIMLFVIGIVAVSDFFYPMPGMMADRFLFVPSLGFAMALVAGLSLLLKINWSDFSLMPGGLPAAMKYGAVVLFAAYGYLTVIRIGDWKDELTLFRHDIKYVDESCQAHNLLAVNLVIHSFNVQSADSQKMLRNEALVHFKKALSIYSGFMNIAFDAGRTYALLNEEDSALVYFKKATDISEGFPAANNEIGKILLNKGRYAEAVTYLERSMKNDPGNKATYQQDAYAYFMLKRYDESLGVTKQAIRQFPNDIAMYVNAGKIFEAKGSKDSALIFYKQAYMMSGGNANLKATIDDLERKP